MKKKPPAPRRPQDAMQRFDRLLAAMAPKVEKTPVAKSPRKGTRRRPKS